MEQIPHSHEMRLNVLFFVFYLLSKHQVATLKVSNYITDWVKQSFLPVLHYISSLVCLISESVSPRSSQNSRKWRHPLWTDWLLQAETRTFFRPIAGEHTAAGFGVFTGQSVQDSKQRQAITDSWWPRVYLRSSAEEMSVEVSVGEKALPYNISFKKVLWSEVWLAVYLQ